VIGSLIAISVIGIVILLVAVLALLYKDYPEYGKDECWDYVVGGLYGLSALLGLCFIVKIIEFIEGMY